MVTEQITNLVWHTPSLSRGCSLPWYLCVSGCVSVDRTNPGEKTGWGEMFCQMSWGGGGPLGNPSHVEIHAGGGWDTWGIPPTLGFHKDLPTVSIKKIWLQKCVFPTVCESMDVLCRWNWLTIPWLTGKNDTMWRLSTSWHYTGSTTIQTAWTAMQ